MKLLQIILCFCIFVSAPSISQVIVYKPWNAHLLPKDVSLYYSSRMEAEKVTCDITHGRSFWYLGFNKPGGKPNLAPHPTVDSVSHCAFDEILVPPDDPDEIRYSASVLVVCPKDLSNNKELEEICGDITKNCTTVATTTNPCDIRTGAKYRHEIDFSSGDLSFTRNYHSQNLMKLGFGVGWYFDYAKRIFIDNDELVLIERSGRIEQWKKQNGVWIGDSDSDYLITESTTGFTVTLKRGDVHEYDLNGKLLSETDSQGKVTNYLYDNENRLTEVINHYQQSITFEYSTDGKDHIVKVVDAQGVEYVYEYDGNDNLIAVIYPDEDNDSFNNPRRIYHYENPDFPNHLTGITDANGERYATFVYDADGKAIESALAPTTNGLGQEQVKLDYQ